MRLTNDKRHAFVRAVISDVPKVDYKEQISKVLMDSAVETLPEQEQHLPSPHTDTLTSIENWHREARPNPTVADINVQLGCHFEEVCEMLESIHLSGIKGDKTTHYREVKLLAEGLKSGAIKVTGVDRKEFIDSVADQIVTGIGVAYCYGMDAPLASFRVNTSNWSKFVDGKAVKDSNGKIIKGAYYKPPNLTGCY